MILLAQSPARDVELVRPLVAGVAVAVGPLPVPVVVEAIAVERLDRRRAHPQVIIDLRQVIGGVRSVVSLATDGERERLVGRGHRTVGVLADVRTRLEAQPPGPVDLSRAPVLPELY